MNSYSEYFRDEWNEQGYFRDFTLRPFTRTCTPPPPPLPLKKNQITEIWIVRERHQRERERSGRDEEPATSPVGHPLGLG
ncbi:hypothetical protein HanPSC8_Chr15g0683751 [Helianthus annuus]|nr:hypothetical protein HanPSC8_Chr15g0683751 [Helianthus annuus]